MYLPWPVVQTDVPVKCVVPKRGIDECINIGVEMSKAAKDRERVARVSLRVPPHSHTEKHILRM